MTRQRPTPRLFFDIETIALPEVEEFLPEPKVDKRLKDQEQAKVDKIAEMVERAPLDPDLGSIRLISMQIGIDGSPTLILVPTKRLTKKRIAELGDLAVAGGSADNPGTLLVLSEYDAIQTFWGKLAICNGACVGYNILGFDLPFLQRRSMDLGVQPGISPAVSKYRTEPVTDLMGILFNWSWGENIKKLKWLAKRYGIDIPAGEDDGSMVKDMTDEDLIKYGLSDLHVTVELYKKMHGIYFNHFGGG